MIKTEREIQPYEGVDVDIIVGGQNRTRAQIERDSRIMSEFIKIDKARKEVLKKTKPTAKKYATEIRQNLLDYLREADDKKIMEIYTTVKTEVDQKAELTKNEAIWNRLAALDDKKNLKKEGTASSKKTKRK